MKSSFKKLVFPKKSVFLERRLCTSFIEKKTVKKNNNWIGWTIGATIVGSIAGYMFYSNLKRKKAEEYEDLSFQAKLQKNWQKGLELATESMDKWLLREKKKHIQKDKAFFLLKQGRYEQVLSESDKVCLSSLLIWPSFLNIIH